MITFYGSGFAPNELVRVYVGRSKDAPGTEVAALRTTSKGTLVAGSGSYALPVLRTAGKVSFVLVGDNSSAAAWTLLQYLAPPAGVQLTLQTNSYMPPPHPRKVIAHFGDHHPILVTTPPRLTIGGAGW